MIDRADAQWYRDAIIYQLHVKAFQDANNDGIGDFEGLMQRLDYVQELGATAIWLLPFYPSPMRDDGYDIADYKAINPAYGKMRDFKGFVAEAHKRGLRVITELVINHTSDQHPWFQRARNAKPGSAARNFYVWSDTDEKFPETRIIFTDTEKSNWTWDPVAGAYFWHRFYSHQPDLNFDNPRVLAEVLKVMHFWLDMGVDGLRLDAIPYLVEREGTNNENLPETHEVLKKIRAELDAHYPDRMLLAEANQWPEDTRPYFGEGDECHMGFHFPLMPRMYMAVAQEDRHPITDIIRQTPDIPQDCQWGIFLRNHDELTLEMVTDKERDYLWRVYAEDPRARINLGIRRRLAPLMQNDRRKIELLNSFLLSFPGTPIVYYGDEIGMGDNYYLGDRDGVRTPMQWSSDRNAGFSRTNPQRLYLPAIQDPVYGYPALNVESQTFDPSSLLNWMRRMIAVRKQHQAFGRGTMTLLYPSNRKVLAYLREYEGEAILCVCNLSRAAQAVELDLSAKRGLVPIELMGNSPFPPIGDLPYLVTLPGYGFYWFVLAPADQAPSWHTPIPDVLPDFLTLTTRDGRITTALTGREGRMLESDVLPRYLPLQRWFAAKDRPIQKVSVEPIGELANGRHALTTVVVTTDQDVERYFLPFSAVWGEESLGFGAPTLAYTLAKLRRGSRVGALVDGAFEPTLPTEMLAAMGRGTTIETDAGRLVFTGNDQLAAIEETGEPRPLGVEQSNVSIVFDTSVILKFYRRLRSGVQPEVEVAQFLTEVAGFENTPAFLGSVEHHAVDGGTTTVAAAFAYVQNQGDAWAVLTEALQRDLNGFEAPYAGADETATEDQLAPFSYPLMIGGLLGQRTGELHQAFAKATDNPAFQVDPITREDVSAWVEEATNDLAEAIEHLSAARGGLAETDRETADQVMSGYGALKARIDAPLAFTPTGGRSRIHGDYHLGQILMVKNDVMIIDFEGEPRRSLEQRRAKTSPLRDVAGLLRSLDYAAASVIEPHGGVSNAFQDAAIARALEWRDTTTRELLAAYEATIAGASTHPDDPAFAHALLDLFVIQKAAYEVAYELSNRPSWAGIPLGGLKALIDEKETGR
ncbi:maltose alpha-D-glucosyltransferase [Amorphus sp. 3PC139-8]|uniref:maltose alpha-D-glucosyltransferase n=1 Tax=Amorphus sp. 3PC139-8 TaxID=2735676 RepID=UPI00345D5BE7